MAAPEAPGKWSALQVLQHLADSEMMVGYRVRLVLTSDRPAIIGYDQDQWVAMLHAVGHMLLLYAGHDVVHLR